MATVAQLMSLLSHKLARHISRLQLPALYWLAGPTQPEWAGEFQRYPGPFHPHTYSSTDSSNEIYDALALLPSMALPKMILHALLWELAAQALTSVIRRASIATC